MEKLKELGNGTLAILAVVVMITALSFLNKVFSIDPKIVNGVLVAGVFITGIKSWEKVQLKK